MKDYNLEIVDAAFVAAGWAQHGKALLYRFHPDQKRNDQFFNDYGLGDEVPGAPIINRDRKPCHIACGR